MTDSLEFLKLQIRQCTLCQSELPLGANPVIRGNIKAKIMIAGQAPGIKVHKTSIPFNDQSGIRLRRWMGIDDDIFYNEDKVAIVPMGFCYPGKGMSGDLAPRAECASRWHHQVIPEFKQVKLTLIIGQYAQAYYLGKKRKTNLTETVKAWQEYSPKFIPLPHPSPRNNRWFKSNPWFEDSVIPEIKKAILELI